MFVKMCYCHNIFVDVVKSTTLDHENDDEKDETFLCRTSSKIITFLSATACWWGSATSNDQTTLAMPSAQAIYVSRQQQVSPQTATDPSRDVIVALDHPTAAWRAASHVLATKTWLVISCTPVLVILGKVNKTWLALCVCLCFCL